MVCLCEERETQLMQRTYALAANNLARNAESTNDTEKYRSLAPYPWSYPVYEAKVIRRKHERTAGTIREIWQDVIKRLDMIDKLALRDTCKMLKRVYDEDHYECLNLRRICFNARNPEEILVLDYQCQRIHQPQIKAAGMPSSSNLPTRFKAMPVLRPARYYERNKVVLDTVYFETIVFEEFKQPSYISDTDWTSRATFHAGVETPSNHVLLETSLAAEPLYLAPGHEHASVMCERWTRIINREWIEYLESGPPPLDDTNNTTSEESSSLATSRSNSPSMSNSTLPSSTSDGVVIAEDTEEDDYDSDEDALLKPNRLALAATNKNANKPAVRSKSKTPVFKGKAREGEKRRYRVGSAPVDLLSGFTVQAINEIVVGRFRPLKHEKWPLMGPIDRGGRKDEWDRYWNKGLTTTSKAWYKDGPLLVFLTDRAAGWMPVNATDPIIFNNMSQVMHTFVVDHLEAVTHYLNLPPLPPPSKCKNPSVSTSDFVWRCFIQTNSDETESLPNTIKEAISGMVLEAWRRTLYNEPVSKESPFCSRCATLVCNADRHADLKPSLDLLKKESAKLRRATAALRFYKSSASCPCSSCKKAAQALLSAATAASSGR